MKYYFCELSQWFNLEPALQTNGETESDVKAVIKKLRKNAPKRDGGEKMIWLMRLMLIKIWSCIVGIIFTA